MKPVLQFRKTLRRLPSRLVGCLGVLLLGHTLAVAAQTYSLLNTFTYMTGAQPKGGLVLANGTLYGTASAGGAGQGGEIFSINPDGSAFTVLQSLTFSNGIQPSASLLYCGGRLYGTATQGGANFDPYTNSQGDGTLFCLDLNGSNFTVLQNFNGPNGQTPSSALIESGGWLYGTTFNGGANGSGTLFKLNTNGTGFTVLKSFSPLSNQTNSDGARPYGGLAQCGGTLYGTTTFGGTNGSGTVFRLATDGSGFAVLKTFSAASNYVNGDGANPRAGLLCDHGTLYGTTYGGGTNGAGTIFKLNQDGSGFALLKTFPGMQEDDINADGAQPYSSLILNGNTLYGTTCQGGTNGCGTVFKVNTTGAGFAAIKHFSGEDGSNPYAGLVMSGMTLFGTATAGGGGNGDGAIYSLALPPFATNPAPTLTIQPFGKSFRLSWNTVAGSNYQLQYTANLAKYNEWINLGDTLQAGGMTLSAIDLAPTNDTRCYRVVVVP